MLIGDAGHAMTPNLGRGACEALADAVTLADLLNNRSVGEALAAYDRGRVARTQALRIASSAVMRVALAERAQPLRDRLLGRCPVACGAAGRCPRIADTSRRDRASEPAPG